MLLVFVIDTCRFFSNIFPKSCWISKPKIMSIDHFCTSRQLVFYNIRDVAENFHYTVKWFPVRRQFGGLRSFRWVPEINHVTYLQIDRLRFPIVVHLVFLMRAREVMPYLMICTMQIFQHGRNVILSLVPVFWGK